MDSASQHDGHAPGSTGWGELEAGTGPEPDGLPQPDDGHNPDGSGEPEDQTPHEPLRFQQWIKRSASGAVLTGIAIGLQQVYQPKRELPGFVMEATGEPEDPNAPINLHFDPDDPTKTVAVIRTPVSGSKSKRPVDPGV